MLKRVSQEEPEKDEAVPDDEDARDEIKDEED